jgi:hypothetical protein
MTQRIRSPKMYLDSRQFVELTQKGMEANSNTGTDSTDGGPVLRQGVPTGSFSGDFVVPSGSTHVAKLIRKMSEGDLVRVAFGIVGTDVLQATCIVDSISLSNTVDDGSFTGSVSLTMRDGKPTISGAPA